MICGGLLVNCRWGGGVEDFLWWLIGDFESDKKLWCGYSVIILLENVLSLVDFSFVLGFYCDGKLVLKGGF